MSAAEFWQKLATRSQSNLYFALVFLPRAEREAFRNVYRFLRAADDVADSGKPLPVILEELSSWRRELDAVYAGRAAHPIALRLAATVEKYALSRQHFETILSALEEDVMGRPFTTTAELERWCAAMSASLAYLCLEILDARGAVVYAHDLGVALQLANIVRDVDEDAARGRVYLPLDSGIRVDDVLQRRYTTGFARACAQLAARARHLTETARASLDAADRRRLIVPEIWADVYLALLRELERHRFDVFAHKPYLKRRKKLAIACLRWMAEKPTLRQIFTSAP